MKKNQFFEDLKEGLNAAVKHREGKIDLKTTSFVAPEAPPELSNKQIKEIREETLHVSQPIFASFLGVTSAAVKAWEQGTKRPSGSARRLTQIITQDPQLLGRIFGLHGQSQREKEHRCPNVLSGICQRSRFLEQHQSSSTIMPNLNCKI